MMDSVLRIFGAYRVYEGRLKSQIERGEVPSHIGIILDGNRRWAANQGMAIEVGHEMGAEIAEELLDWCHELNIKTVTLYVLSTENLKRTPEEVKELLALIEERLTKLLNDERIYKYKVKVKAIGQLDLLPGSIRNLLSEIENRTAGFGDHYLNIAVAYGGRAEIRDMVKSVAQDVRRGVLSPDQISDEIIEKKL